MNYLLDTHVCFWAVYEKAKLSVTVRNILQDPENQITVSAISFWEIAIKYRLGKFPEFDTDLTEFIAALIQSGFTLLPIKNEHFIAYFNYPHFSADHKDPFDRLLLVTADLEKAEFITKDEKFDVYKERMNIVW